MRNITVIDWVKYLESIKEASSNTIKSYQSDVVNFLQYMSFRFNLVDNNLDEINEINIDNFNDDYIKKIGIRDIISYINYTDTNLNNSAATRSRKLSALRSFFDYLYKIIALINENPMNLVDGPKLPKRLPNHLELEEVKRLLETVLQVEKEFYRHRDFAILMLFLNTGLRLSELVNIKNQDFDKNNVINIIGKGNKQRQVILNEATKSAIKSYQSVRPLDSDVDNLFVNSNGKRHLAQRGIQYMLDKYLKLSGLSNKYSPHTLRHTAATLLFQYGGVDIRTLQVILGHESVSTTQIYTHVSVQQLEKAVELNPIKDILSSDQ